MNEARAKTIRGWVVSKAGTMHPIEREVDTITHAQLFLDRREAQISRSIDSDEHILPVKVTIYPVCESCGHRLVGKRRPQKLKPHHKAGPKKEDVN